MFMHVRHDQTIADLHEVNKGLDDVQQLIDEVRSIYPNDPYMTEQLDIAQANVDAKRREVSTLTIRAYIMCA